MEITWEALVITEGKKKKKLHLMGFIDNSFLYRLSLGEFRRKFNQIYRTTSK